MTGCQYNLPADIVAVIEELQVFKTQLFGQHKRNSIESCIEISVGSNQSYIILNELKNNFTLLIGRIDPINTFKNKRMVCNNQITIICNRFINNIQRDI